MGEQEDMLSRTYLACLQNMVIGFFALAASCIEVLEIDITNGINEFPGVRYPAIEITYLAVTEKLQGKRIGEKILYIAIGKILSISEIIGCRYIILDSVKNKVGFYKNYGFKIVEIFGGDEYIKMYLNIAPIKIKLSNSIRVENSVHTSID